MSEKSGVVFMGTFFVLGAIVHFWTIVKLADFHGFFAGVIGCMLPGFSQAYCFVKVGMSQGFFSGYCIAVIATVISFGLMVWSLNRTSE